jgi:hypothetical protein
MVLPSGDQRGVPATPLRVARVRTLLPSATSSVAVPALRSMATKARLSPSGEKIGPA